MSAEETKKASLRIRLPFQTEQEFIERYGAHIATNGIFIATRKPKPLGTQVSFELVLHDGGRLMRGEGVVEESYEEGPRFGMWVRFLKIDAPTKVLIEQALTFHGQPLSPPLAPPRSSPPVAPPRTSVPTPAPRPSVPTPAPRPSAPNPALHSVLGISWGTHLAHVSAMVSGAPLQIHPVDSTSAAWPVPEPSEHAGWLEVMTRAHAAAEQQLEHPVKRTVLCVPSTFTSKERRLLIEAATAAGLQVLQVVNDASAVALAFANGRGLARKRVVVVNVEEGQCSAAVVQATGDDLSVVAGGGHSFEGAAELGPVLNVIQGVLDAARVNMASVDEVVCVGAQAEAPDIRERLHGYFAGRPVHTELPSAQAAGVGLLAQAWSLRERGKIGASVAEVVLAPLFLSAQSNAATRLLDRGTRLPADKSVAVWVEPAETVELCLFEGDAHKTCVGTWRGSVDKRVEWTVTVRLDSEKGLALSATAPGGKKVELTFDGAANPTFPRPPPAVVPAPPEPGLLSGLKRWLTK